MNVQSLLSPQYWTGRAIDTYWRWQAAPQEAGVALTWPIDRELLKDVVITWPAVYEWAPFWNWGEQLRVALARFVETQVGDVPQPYRGVIVFMLTHRGRRFRVNVEVSDYLDLNEQAYDHADLHFKMQYRLEGYGARDPLVPGGYLNNHSDIYAFLPHLRALRDTAPPLYDVHGRFGLSFEVRRKALEILRSTTAFRFFGGQTKVRYGSFLREVARARICIDLPSYSPITFRLVDYLAIGSCVIGPPHGSQLHVPLEDRVHVVYCKPDYSDLEALCLQYLSDEGDRLALIENSRRFFDQSSPRSASRLLLESLRSTLPVRLRGVPVGVIVALMLGIVLYPQLSAPQQEPLAPEPPRLLHLPTDRPQAGQSIRVPASGDLTGGPRPRGVR